jgi:hypothetical protein
MDKHLIRQNAALQVRIMDLEAQIRAANHIIKALLKEKAEREVKNELRSER